MVLVVGAANRDGSDFSRDKQLGTFITRLVVRIGNKELCRIFSEQSSTGKSIGNSTRRTFLGLSRSKMRRECGVSPHLNVGVYGYGWFSVQSRRTTTHRVQIPI